MLYMLNLQSGCSGGVHPHQRSNKPPMISASATGCDL